MKPGFKAVGSKNKVDEMNICVNSYGSKPYNLFSPFTYSPQFRIPVPGQKDEYSCSVEAIWQGLKIVDGQIDKEMFQKKPKKRKGNVLGHLFNGSILDLVSARKLIYSPAYSAYFNQYIPRKLKDNLLTRSLSQEIAFFDTEDNLDINDPISPLAHSVFLVECFENYREERFNELTENLLDLYRSNNEDMETLAEPVSRAITFFNSSTPDQKDLIKFVLKSRKPKDKSTGRYYDYLSQKLSL